MRIRCDLHTGSRILTNSSTIREDLARRIAGQNCEWRVPRRFAENPNKVSILGLDPGIF